VFAGPYATQILGDLGADVVKVERIDGGDECRVYGVVDESETVGPPFMAMNRNKRSITIDTRTNDGRAVIYQLVRKSDVIVDNFRQGVMNRLGLDYDSVRHVNPRIISCSISGFGKRGHLHTQAANDLSVQAATGLLSMTGEEEGPPVRTPASIGDISSGLYCAIGILAALFDRERTGVGQEVDTSLFESLLSVISHFFVDYWLRGNVAGKMGTANTLGMPNQAFPALDGWVCISASNERAFRRLCEVMGVPELAADSRFAKLSERYKHRRELTSLLSDITRTYTLDRLINKLEEASISFGPVRTVADVANDKLIEELGIVWILDMAGVGPVKVVGSPLHFSSGTRISRLPPPVLGEHTEDILGELGYTNEEITALQDRRVVGRGSASNRATRSEPDERSTFAPLRPSVPTPEDRQPWSVEGG